MTNYNNFSQTFAINLEGPFSQTVSPDSSPKSHNLSKFHPKKQITRIINPSKRTIFENSYSSQQQNSVGSSPKSPAAALTFNPSKSLSIYLKIFINYAQNMAIIHNLNLRWPTYVATYLKTSGSVGTVSSQIFSLDCFLNDFNFEIELIYFKAFFTTFLYLSLLSTSAFYFITKQMFLKRKNQFSKYIIFVVVLSILIQPNGIREASDIFTCIKIEDKEYVKQQMSVECYSRDHNFWV